MKSVNAQVIFITGGAGGIGAAVARRLHAKGATVVLTDVDEAGLAELAADLGDDRVLTVSADVRDLAALQSAADAAVRRFGGIDAVVANAGIASNGSVLQVDPDAFKRVLDINVLGVFHTVRATLPAVLARRGYVLIVSSLSAYAASPGSTSYDTAKAGVEHLADGLRLELGHRGVAVGSAHMSFIDTALVRECRDELPAFRAMLAKLPWPLSITTSVDRCAAAFVDGIERRRSHVYCPGWVRLFRWLKPVLSTGMVESLVRSSTSQLLHQLDTEVAALGRSTSARVEALGNR
ncbi:SDR family oxidoreductase [Mycobacterium talmoniae]|uniref:Putative NAD-dependent oxidoreductase n=1 Tax=Mycobacterium talmoniae TaxID=1858794 RepID=A0A1S1NEI9_9MYCO|nr:MULTISPECIES: SDR family oxidoreductase [Mycobacterium]OHU98097.1 short-chain dehydrogenase [Mycobacterium talmoniae]PQM44946.1 putative NAD-dependent oxidoreductase [Mycobacterium talmoniae]TDH57160.1 SDR family oxidoreductase [Mycobacterium eburneum]